MDDSSDLVKGLEDLSLRKEDEEEEESKDESLKKEESEERARAKEEQRKEFWKEKRKRRKERLKEKGVPRKKRFDDPIHPLQKPIVVIDMSYAELQTTKEIRSLANQVGHIYGAHRRAPKPLHLHLTSVHGAIADALATHDGFAKKKWELESHSEHVFEVFSDQIENIVYFSPDAEDVCGELEEDKVYVIGGIVDRDRLKGVSFKASQEKEIKAVRLPINECGLLEEGEKFPNKSLNVNTMYNVLLGYSEHQNWKDALRPVLPTRRGFKTQGAKEGGDTTKEEETPKESES